MNLTHRQQQIYEILKENPNVNYTEIQEKLECTRATISLTIQKLQAMNKIKVIGYLKGQTRILT